MWTLLYSLSSTFTSPISTLIALPHHYQPIACWKDSKHIRAPLVQQRALGMPHPIKLVNTVLPSRTGNYWTSTSQMNTTAANHVVVYAFLPSASTQLLQSTQSWSNSIWETKCIQLTNEHHTATKHSQLRVTLFDSEKRCFTAHQ